MEYLLPLVFVAIFGAITGGLAARKGYAFFAWFFAAGILGLLILAFLPFTNKGDMPPDVAGQKRKSDNTTGIVISVIAVVLGVARLALGH